MSKPIAVEVKVLQGDGLGADVAATERIVFIAANRKTLLTFHGDFNATDRLAQIATAVMRSDLRHGVLNINSAPTDQQ
jgi:hypothetical protein